MHEPAYDCKAKHNRWGDEGLNLLLAVGVANKLEKLIQGKIIFECKIMPQTNESNFQVQLFVTITLI